MPLMPAAVSQTCQSSGKLPICSRVKRLRSAGFLSGFGPLSSDGAQTGMTSSPTSRSAISPGHWPRP